MREVINAHIVENMTSYQAYCRSLYNGRYVADDLFQEFYLYAQSIPVSRIEGFHAQNKLKYLCIRIIRDLFLRRGRKRVKGETAPLYELCNACETNFDFKRADNEGYSLSEDEKYQLGLDAIQEKRQTQHDWFNTEVAVLSQQESISAIHRATKISRSSLSAACNQAKLEIRRYVDKRRKQSD